MEIVAPERETLGAALHRYWNRTHEFYRRCPPPTIESHAMPDVPKPKTDRIGNDFHEGPNPGPGGTVEPGGLVPPYEGRTTDDSDPSGTAASVRRQLDKTKDANAGQTASPAEESPARPEEVTDEVPESPKGVGTSNQTGAEEIADRDGKEPGRTDTGEDAAGRPTGTSDERDRSSLEE